MLKREYLPRVCNLSKTNSLCYKFTDVRLVFRPRKMLVAVGVSIARKVESLANVIVLRAPARSGVGCDSIAGRCVRVTRFCTVYAWRIRAKGYRPHDRDRIRLTLNRVEFSFRERYTMVCT